MSFDLNIKLAHLKNLPSTTDVVVIWKRGTTTIDTKVKQLGPDVTEAVFNDKYEMRTQMDYDNLLKKFPMKKSNLELWRGNQSQLVGVAELDLGKYANMPEGVMHKDQLPLKDCLLDKTAYIEILIKTKIERDVSPSNSSSSSSRNARSKTPLGT